MPNFCNWQEHHHTQKKKHTITWFCFMFYLFILPIYLFIYLFICFYLFILFIYFHTQKKKHTITWFCFMFYLFILPIYLFIYLFICFYLFIFFLFIHLFWEGGWQWCELWYSGHIYKAIIEYEIMVTCATCQTAFLVCLSFNSVNVEWHSVNLSLLTIS